MATLVKTLLFSYLIFFFSKPLNALFTSKVLFNQLQIIEEDVNLLGNFHIKNKEFKRKLFKFFEEKNATSNLSQSVLFHNISSIIQCDLFKKEHQSKLPFFLNLYAQYVLEKDYKIGACCSYAAALSVVSTSVSPQLLNSIEKKMAQLLSTNNEFSNSVSDFLKVIIKAYPSTFSWKAALKSKVIQSIINPISAISAALTSAGIAGAAFVIDKTTQQVVTKYLPFKRSNKQLEECLKCGFAAIATLGVLTVLNKYHEYNV